jgi:ribosomal protein L22
MTPEDKDPKDKVDETPDAEETTDAQAPEAEAAEEPKPKPKPKRTRKPKPKAEEAEAPAAETAETPEEEPETAAEETGVDKVAAEAEVAKPKARRPRPKPADRNPEGTQPEGTEDDAAVAAVDKPAKEAAARPRERDRRKPAEPGVLVRAQARYVRTSARKARLVCDHIRGKDVTEARSILAFTPRAAAVPWLKLLESAVANAEHNHELVGEDLRIAAVHADEGPTLKRFRPRAMGRATRIRKRTSHLTITLTPKES